MIGLHMNVLKSILKQSNKYISLKNEALKERNWKALIEKIEARLDFNQNVVTLTNILGFIREKPQRLEKKKVNTLTVNDIHACYFV